MRLFLWGEVHEKENLDSLWAAGADRCGDVDWPRKGARIASIDHSIHRKHRRTRAVLSRGRTFLEASGEKNSETTKSTKKTKVKADKSAPLSDAVKALMGLDGKVYQKKRTRRKGHASFCREKAQKAQKAQKFQLHGFANFELFCG
jgi:hypothetical protein